MTVRKIVGIIGAVGISTVIVGIVGFVAYMAFNANLWASIGMLTLLACIGAAIWGGSE